MATIAENLQILKDSADAIKQVILDKGGIVNGGIATFADSIRDLEGSTPTLKVESNDVNFYDYNGTLLYSYTWEDAMALTELPPLPTHEGLICQEWNYTLDDIKNQDGYCDVGATYITDDGKTRLYIHLDYEQDITLSFSAQTVDSSSVVDWGDGTVETIVGTSGISINHSYASAGDYVILITVGSGTLTLGGGSSSVGLFGGIVDSNVGTRSSLRKVEIGSGVAFSSYIFMRMYSLETITIPNSITDFQGYSFQYSYNLKALIIPRNVKRIRYSVAYHCYSLNMISIPSSVTQVDNYAIANCYGINRIIFPVSVTSSGGSFVSNCYTLKLLVLGKNMNFSGTGICSGDYTLSYVKYTEKASKLPASVFSNCFSISFIEFAQNIANVDASAFSNCYNLKEVSFKGNTSVPTLANVNAFNNTTCIIKVPASLYDAWISASNWSSLSNQIIAI